MGDLNWDGLSAYSNCLKIICNEINLTQLVSSPNRKSPDKSTLIDLILTNTPQKYKGIGVFSNDISDRFSVECVRDTKLPKFQPCILININFKRFVEQASLHELNICDFSRISLITDMNVGWNYFHLLFLLITDKRAHLTYYRIKRRDNPWFSNELSSGIHERNAAWVLAKTTNLQSDWTHILGTSTLTFIRKCKSDFYLKSMSSNLNNPSKFWKKIKSLETNSGKR